GGEVADRRRVPPAVVERDRQRAVPEDGGALDELGSGVRDAVGGIVAGMGMEIGLDHAGGVITQSSSTGAKPRRAASLRDGSLPSTTPQTAWSPFRRRSTMSAVAAARPYPRPRDDSSVSTDTSNHR